MRVHERAVSECVVLLVWLIIGFDLLPSGLGETVSQDIKALLQIPLPVC